MFEKKVRKSSMNCYVIWDKLAEKCGPLFEAANDEVARRQVWRLLRSVVPYDRDVFILYRVAEINMIDFDPPFEVNGKVSVVNIDMPRFMEAEEQGKLDFEKGEKHD